MGWYSEAVLPRLLDWSLSAKVFADLRRALLSRVSGQVLEIGFGTGLNVAYYDPEQVTTLVGVDKNPGMNALALRRIARSRFHVEHYVCNGESLPFLEEEFDSVVSTWTLCSIEHLDRAIAEIHRVLKTGGTFYFLEHGLSSNAKVQTWQQRLTPLQKSIADGCHLDRDIASAICHASFELEELRCFPLSGLPEVVGYTYFGCARKT